MKAYTPFSLPSRQRRTVCYPGAKQFSTEVRFHWLLFNEPALTAQTLATSLSSKAKRLTLLKNTPLLTTRDPLMICTCCNCRNLIKIKCIPKSFQEISMHDEILVKLVICNLDLFFFSLKHIFSYYTYIYSKNNAKIEKKEL